MRSNQFNPRLIKEMLIKPIAIVGFIANNPIRRMLSKVAVDSGLTKVTSWGETLSA